MAREGEKLLKAAAGAFLLWILFKPRRASAAPSPRNTLPRGADGSAETRREPATTEAGPMQNAAEVFNRWRDAFLRYSTPVPPGALAYLAYHESRGVPGSVNRGNHSRDGDEPGRRISPFVEAGILHEAVYKNGNDGPTKKNFDPLDPVSAIYGRQAIVADQIRGMNTILSAKGYSTIANSRSTDAVAAMMVPHFVGQREFRALLEKVGPSNGRGLCQAIGEWAATPESYANDPAYGTQTGTQMRTRMDKACAIFRHGENIHDTPDDRLASMAAKPRGPEVRAKPAGLYERVRRMLWPSG